MIEMLKARPIAINRLRPHPKQYRDHPDDQVDHLVASLEQFGFYRNIIVARDLTILGGHGIVEAMKRLGQDKVMAVVLDIDPDSPRALKVLAGDNYLSSFALDDDRMLTELLSEVQAADSLLGTGFDDLNLSALIMVSRTAGEIAALDASGEWAGMPAFDIPENTPILLIHFETEEQREQLVEQLGIVPKRGHRVWSGWWPTRQRIDRRAVRWQEER